MLLYSTHCIFIGILFFYDVGSPKIYMIHTNFGADAFSNSLAFFKDWIMMFSVDSQKKKKKKQTLKKEQTTQNA